jgi:uncharacterized protein YegP (UPF0339 family)
MDQLSRRSAIGVGAAALATLITTGSLGSESAPPFQEPRLKFELYRDRRGRFRWRLKAANGREIGNSGEGYNAKADCRTAIDRIRQGAATATVEDQT